MNLENKIRKNLKRAERNWRKGISSFTDYLSSRLEDSFGKIGEGFDEQRERIKEAKIEIDRINKGKKNF